ncbi:MAG: hypothetical protein CMN26_02925 [Salinisphaera sp.]|nr:hypothetical protein [Salinisphaera sp.]|tara:strand:+ start:498 stop:893 length:396 start_codon:yes stop_codon:yes gene_type:complete
MSRDRDSAWLSRFLAPRHAIAECAIIQWHGLGEADTPGEDAHCRIQLACEHGGDDGRIVAAAFAAFGPPVVVACSDWVCEQVEDRTIKDARSLNLRAIEQALVLAAGERYAALLVMDALDMALARASSNLG